MEQYYSRNSRPDITAKHLEQYHSRNSHNRYNSYHSYNTYNVQQQSNSQIEQSNRITAITEQQDNSIKLFLQVWSNITMAEWEMNRTTRIIRTLCVACKRVKATRPDHLCDECRAKHKGWSMWQHYKGSSKSRGYGYAWNKLRLKALERDKHLCQMCLKRGIFTTATDVDHIIPLAQGGSDAMENLQSLCHECHKQKTCQERLNNKNYLHDKT